MMEDAAYIGVPISEFWQMTPREIGVYAKAYSKRESDKFELFYREAISIAYLNSKWTIQWLGKKQHHPPGLEKILDSLGKEKEPMTDEQMLNQVKMLNAMFGGEEKTR